MHANMISFRILYIVRSDVEWKLKQEKIITRQIAQRSGPAEASLPKVR